MGELWIVVVLVEPRVVEWDSFLKAESETEFPVMGFEVDEVPDTFTWDVFSQPFINLCNVVRSILTVYFMFEYTSGPPEELYQVHYSVAEPTQNQQ